MTIRVTNKVKETEASSLLKKRGEIKQKISLEPNNSVLKEELDAVTNDLTKLVAKDNCEKIMENFGHLDQTFGESFAGGVWGQKKKIFPKVTPPVPAAKMDANGKLVTDIEGLKALYEDTFLHRLRQRKIKKRYSDLYELQQGLLQMRLLLTKDEKTPDWSEKDV